LQAVTSHIVDWTGKLHSFSVDLSVADTLLVLPLRRGTSSV